MKMQTLILDTYRPHSAQKEFHKNKSRFRVAAFGRQAGKSTACNNEIAHRAWKYPNTHYWFISPVHAQAKEQYRRLLRFLPPGVIKKKSDTELRVDLINDSVIEYKSGESLDNLRGSSLHFAVIDEVRDQHPELWPLVIRPMLTTTQGGAAFVSTPNGYDSFYDLYETARSDTSNQWSYFHAPSTCNPLFTQAEFDAAKSTMGEAEFAQEILAEFRDLHQGSAYLNFSEANITPISPVAIGTNEIYSEYLPIMLGCDFNVSPMAWVIGQKRAEKFYFFDEIFMKGTHTQEVAEVFCQKFKANYKIKTQPQVIIVGDATGNANKTSSAGSTDYIQLCQTLDAHGITWANQTPPSNPPVKDRINQVNAKLKSASGERSLFVHPQCIYIIRDCQRVSWKQGSDRAVLDQTTNKDLTHSSDGVGYVICALEPMRLDNNSGRLIIINRR